MALRHERFGVVQPLSDGVELEHHLGQLQANAAKILVMPLKGLTLDQVKLMTVHDVLLAKQFVHRRELLVEFSSQISDEAFERSFHLLELRVVSYPVHRVPRDGCEVSSATTALLNASWR